MKTFYSLIPLLVVVLGNVTDILSCSDIAMAIVNIVISRPNNLPNPSEYGLFTFDSVLDRNGIRKVTKGVSGIYCWVNKSNGRCYVGKSNNLYLRLSNYYQSAHVIKHRHTSLICRAINKHGIDSFLLVVLELSVNNLSEAEQKWIDLLNPEYNTIKDVITPDTI